MKKQRNWPDLETLGGEITIQCPESRDFVQQMKNIKLQQHECIIPYDVKVLFTSVPIEPAIGIIKKHLEEDEELQQRTSMTVNNIMDPCLFGHSGYTSTRWQSQHYNV